MHSLCSLLTLIIMLTIKSGDDKPTHSGLRSWTSPFPVATSLCTGLRWPRATHRRCQGRSTWVDISSLCQSQHHVPVAEQPRDKVILLMHSGTLTRLVRCLGSLGLYIWTMVGFVWSRRQIFSYYWTTLMCWDSSWSSEYLSREGRQFKTVLFGSKLAEGHNRYWHFSDQLLQI